MSYALFAHRKVELTGLLNCVSLQQTERSNEQFRLASNTLNTQQKLSSLQSGQSNQLSDMYKELCESSTEEERFEIQNRIKDKEASFDAEIDALNREIYLISVKENTVEMQVKRLDTQISTLQKQLEAVEQAESGGIDRATPKFQGVG